MRKQQWIARMVLAACFCALAGHSVADPPKKDDAKQGSEEEMA
jgi:hypothetical protein